ncbi:SDR family NAD(P)-dependent oxidoreductase [Alicyclobacillus sp. SO9]|uniref:SDR family NAD(P)-dependent oxidoreductase n=1 Tax=Alicyclobacillus sp. SO9 TaxID=2665646 RepID=UPI0018E70B28|nr:SDR family oxidoreductase [Alicyclobacillus sp. SO9]QQE80571.1 SDR family oxidoreductase [Alicyclobacillus sp. SO9]
MLQKPVIAITGGTRGLGYALAKALLEDGFAVSVCARRTEEVKEAGRALSDYGPVLAQQVDVTDAAATENWLQSTKREFGRIDGLVHNASSIGDVPMPVLQNTTAANMRQVLEVNTVAPVLMTQQALPILLEQPRALVVAISSDAAVGGYEGWGVYGASKSALDLIAKTFASELAEKNVQVVSVDPGDMDTEMHHDAAPADNGLPAPAMSASAMMALFRPLRTGEPWPSVSGSRLSVHHDDGKSLLAGLKGEDE